MSIEEGGGGASDEERTEAEKFDAKVPEDKLTPAEMAEVERSKTPEEVEAGKEAMEKVIDINQEGTAFSAISAGTEKNQTELFERIIRNVLTEGLLGTDQESREKFRQEDETNIKEVWTKSVRNRQSLVYFNIVGKSAKSVGNSYYMQQYENPVAIIFDLSRFKEVPSVKPSDLEKEKFGHHTYRTWRPGLWSEKKGPSEWGFALSSRVAPKDFLGIVSAYASEQALSRIMKIQNEVYKNKKGMILPVYHQWGDLLWPRRMTYEQVKQFVAERDKKKKESGDEQTK